MDSSLNGKVRTSACAFYVLFIKGTATAYDGKTRLLGAAEHMPRASVRGALWLRQLKKDLQGSGH